MIDEFKVHYGADIVDRFAKMNHALAALSRCTSGIIIQRNAAVNIFQKRSGRIRVWSSFLSPTECNTQGYHFWKTLKVL